ncbi:MAG TPA: 2-alkenal reductase, partial [Methyloversatilis sp.]
MKPEWLPSRGQPAAPVIAADVGTGTNTFASEAANTPTRIESAKVISYADAAQKALPSVVHVFTTK